MKKIIILLIITIVSAQAVSDSDVDKLKSDMQIQQNKSQELSARIFRLQKDVIQLKIKIKYLKKQYEKHFKIQETTQRSV